MDQNNMDRKAYLKSLALLTVPVALAACRVTPSPAAGFRVRVAFSEPMNRTNVESAARLMLGTQSVTPRSVSWVNDGTAIFDFGSQDTEAITSFTLSADGPDLAGNPLAAYEEAYA